MAFIKRSKVQPVNVKVGNQMCKCSSCGEPFVSRIKINLCPKCTPRTVSIDDDGNVIECTPRTVSIDDDGNVIECMPDFDVE